MIVCIYLLILLSLFYPKTQAIDVNRNSMLSRIRVISLDITGTILSFKAPIADTYADYCIKANLPDPPSKTEIKQAFKQAYAEQNAMYPCFGYNQISIEQWWRQMVFKTIDYTGRKGVYSDDALYSYFQLVYQHYLSLDAYDVHHDTASFIAKYSQKYELGIISNTPTTTIDRLLPLTSLDKHFQWSVCSHKIGNEKPSIEIYEAAYMIAKDSIPSLQRSEILHVGDSYHADCIGAIAAGYQAVYLDRAKKGVQDWLHKPDYLSTAAPATANNIYIVKDFNEIDNIFNKDNK